VAPKQGRPRRLTGRVLAPMRGGSGLKFDPNSNSNGFKQIQILIDQKGTLPSSKKSKQNMVVKDLKKGTTFFIGTSSDSKCILN
jgi:hypothetical protein